ncbi:MAG: sugar ABC transporter permease [Propionibacteriaceae bacterium]|nr:sugar ABC transporter permease [Propionibacteriaceae bacterium]
MPSRLRRDRSTRDDRAERRAVGRRGAASRYSQWFYLPAVLLYVVFLAVPTVVSFYFSLTRWTLFDTEFIGLKNFASFLTDQQLSSALTNTLVYGVTTAGAKIVLGTALAVFLTSELLGRGYLRAVVFFPALVSVVGIGLTFKALLDPFHGVVNALLGFFGLPEPGWYTDPDLALLTVAGIDVWKGVGISTLILIAGLVAIPRELTEAARVDGASPGQVFRHIKFPLLAPALGTVVLLSLIGGLRSFDLIWAVTGGGPGFSSDTIASVIYKQYQAGFYGVSTAGNVILFVVVLAIVIPLQRVLNRREHEL